MKFAILGFALCLFTANTELPFVTPDEYSADIVILSADGTKYLTQKIYVSDGKTRKESSGPNGKSIVTIVRRDMNAIYQLKSSERTYKAYAISKDKPFEEDLRDRAEWTLAGTKEFNGRIIERWTGVAKHGKEIHNFIYWIDRGTRFPIRRSFNGQIVNIMNIHPGSQNPLLFEVPKSFVRQ